MPELSAMQELLALAGVKDRCRGCGAEIAWIQYQKGPKIPYNQDGTVHSKACVEAAARKPLAEDLIESTKKALRHDLDTLLSTVDDLDHDEGLKVLRWAHKVLLYADLFGAQ